jgi:peptidoglycan/LPS O-acetylase OafA/YrhL
VEIEKARWVQEPTLAHNNFDFLRWTLAILVIFSHSFALLNGGDESEPLMRVTRGQLTFGGLAVNWFFVISGFLITHSWLRTQSVAAFLRKRARRILPGFVVAMMFCALVVAPWSSEKAADAFSATHLAGWLKGIVTLRGYDYPDCFASNPYPGAINGSVWSIAYECWCYFGVMLLGLAGVLQKRRVIISLCVASVVVSTAFVFFQWRPGGGVLRLIVGSPRLWARLLPYYLSGVVFYLVKERIPWSNRLATIGVLFVVVGCLVPHGLTVLLPLAGSYLLFWFAFHPVLRLENWAARGDLSYGIYLYAFPVQQLVIQWWPGMGPLGLFTVSTPLSILMGFVSWHLVERRWLVRRPCIEVERSSGVVAARPS